MSTTLRKGREANVTGSDLKLKEGMSNGNDKASPKNTSKLRDLINSMQKSPTSGFSNLSFTRYSPTPTKAVRGFPSSTMTPKAQTKYAKEDRDDSHKSYLNQDKYSAKTPSAKKTANAIHAKVYGPALAQRIAVKTPNSSKTTQAQSNNTSRNDSIKHDFSQKGLKNVNHAPRDDVLVLRAQTEPDTIYTEEDELARAIETEYNEMLNDSLSSLNSRTPAEGQASQIAHPTFSSHTLAERNAPRPTGQKGAKIALNATDMVRPASALKGDKFIKVKRLQANKADNTNNNSTSKSKDSINNSYRVPSKAG